MNKILIKRQNGMAIMEALLALLVLGVGVAALLYLQGNLMSGSALSKARAEAMKIAEDSISDVRNYVDGQQYKDAVADLIANPSKEVTPDDSDRVNVERYVVTYTFSQEDAPGSLEEIDATTNPIDLSKFQQIEVEVEWEGNELASDGSRKKESVTLASNYFFLKPEIASAIGSDKEESDLSDFPIPSPWITGEEGPHKSTEKLKPAGDDEEPNGNLMSTVTDTHMVMQINDAGSFEFNPEEVDIVYYVDPDTGHSNVEVVHGWLDESKKIPHVRLTSFGGGVNKISGEIILHPGAQTSLIAVGNHLELLASPPSYCVFPICNDASIGQTTACTKDENGAEYVSYVCYVPADCTHGGFDCDIPGTAEILTGDASRNTDDGFQPPLGRDLLPDEEHPDRIYGLNGGWYGRVGNFNIFLAKKDDMVCVADTDIGGSEPNLTPSREYVTHRWELDGSNKKIIAGNEGINRSLNCQTFIITTKTNGDTACLDIAAEYNDFDGIPDNGGTLLLPPENMIRWVGEKGAIPTLASDALPDIMANVVLPPSNGTGKAEPIPASMPEGTRPATILNVVLPVYNDYCPPPPPPTPETQKQ